MSALADHDVADALAAYVGQLREHAAGLEAFLALARRQAEVARLGDADALTAIVHDRDAALARLVDAAAGLAPMRRWADGLGPAWADRPDWQAVAAARQRARELVDAILAQDELTRGLLEETAASRQQARLELDAANATLHAYRRAIVPASRPASLFDHRG